MGYHWNWHIFLEPVSTGEPSTYLGWLFSGLELTVALSLGAWAVALALGLLLGIGRTLANPFTRAFGIVYVAVFRNVPLIVQAFIWYYALPDLVPTATGNWFKALPPTTQFLSSSIICLGCFTAARICEQVRASLQMLPRGQRAAAHALGLSTGQSYRYVLLPVALRHILPTLTSELLNVLKNSAVFSTIGLLELSAQARQLVDYTAQTYEAFIAVTIAYMIVNLSAMAIMRAIDRRVRLPIASGAR